MTRTEFTQIFTPMVKALQVKMLPAQAEYFFEAYGHADARDFAQACRELGMSTPGYLPKISLFRDALATANERRVERDSQLLRQAGERFMHDPPTHITREHPGDEQYGPIFAQCCHALMKAGRLVSADRKPAIQFIEQQLENEGFTTYMQSWRTQGNMVALAWLQAQAQGVDTHTPRYLHPSIKVWSREDYHAVRLARLEREAAKDNSHKKQRR